jgi:hypothetical protein
MVLGPHRNEVAQGIRPIERSGQLIDGVGSGLESGLKDHVVLAGRADDRSGVIDRRRQRRFAVDMGARRPAEANRRGSVSQIATTAAASSF